MAYALRLAGGAWGGALLDVAAATLHRLFQLALHGLKGGADEGAQLRWHLLDHLLFLCHQLFVGGERDVYGHAVDIAGAARALRALERDVARNEIPGETLEVRQAPRDFLFQPLGTRDTVKDDFGTALHRHTPERAARCPLRDQGSSYLIYDEMQGRVGAVVSA